MDYFKNVDKLCHDNYHHRSVKGVEYHFITDLSVEPVDLAFFKQHAKIDYNLDNNLCTNYIKAARQHLERVTQLSFGERTMQMTALSMVDNWKLMYGPVDTVKAPYTKFGKDIITNSGGTNVTIEYTTKWALGLPDDLKIAICRYAAGLYAIRENHIITEKGDVVEPKNLLDEAEKMAYKYANISFL